MVVRYVLGQIAVVGALCGALAAEIVPQRAQPVASSLTRSLAAVSARSVTLAPSPARMEANVEAILARPLMRPDRRPPHADAAAAAAKGLQVAPMPRLSGIMVSTDHGAAIFEGGSKPVIAHVGDRLGAFTVAAIGATSVLLSGPAGERQVAPTYTLRTAEPADTATQAAAQVNDMDRLMSGDTARLPIPPAPSLLKLLSQHRTLYKAAAQAQRSSLEQ